MTGDSHLMDRSDGASIRRLPAPERRGRRTEVDRDAGDDRRWLGWPPNRLPNFVGLSDRDLGRDFAMSWPKGESATRSDILARSFEETQIGGRLATGQEGRVACSSWNSVDYIFSTVSASASV